MKIIKIPKPRRFHHVTKQQFDLHISYYLWQVVNAQLPVDSVGYLHRAGRTARMGKHGTVLNLLSDYDAPLYKKIKFVSDKDSMNFNDTMRNPPKASRLPDQVNTTEMRHQKKRELEPWLRDNPATFVSKIYRNDFEIK